MRREASFGFSCTSVAKLRMPSFACSPFGPLGALADAEREAEGGGSGSLVVPVAVAVPEGALVAGPVCRYFARKMAKGDRATPVNTNGATHRTATVCKAQPEADALVPPEPMFGIPSVANASRLRRE